MDTTTVMAYEVSPGKRVALHKVDGELIITNTVTNKSLLCVGWTHALDMFDWCVQVMKTGVLN